MSISRDKHPADQTPAESDAIEVLHLEDSDLDAEFVQSRLRNSGLAVAVERVVDRESFVERLKSKRYELILSDYQVPTFEGLAALELAQQYQPETPFIFVSGTMGEELAIETLKRGATDYVLKDRLARLPTAIERAITEARQRAERVAAELLVLEANERAASILESINDAFLTLDHDWRFVYVNRQAERTLRRAPGELLGKVIWNEFPGLVGSTFEELYRRVAQTQQAETAAAFYPDHNCWYEVRSFPCAEGLSVYFQDISERVRAEEQLKRATEANAKFRTMFEQGSQFAGILSLDGIVVEANRLCLEQCGYTRADVIGRPFWQCGWWNRSQAIADTVRTATLRAAQGEMFRGESVYFISNGSERVVDLILSPVMDDHGQVLFVAATGTDVTERKSAEQRHQFLADLAAATQQLSDAAEVIGTTARMLGEFLGCQRCAYAEIEDESTFVITGNYLQGVASIAGRWPIAGFGSECQRLMLAGEPYVVTDAYTDSRIDARHLAAYQATSITACICVPLLKGGRLTAAMAVHQTESRQWTEEETSVVQLVVGRCWESLERARVMRALEESEARFRQLAETIPNLAWMARPDGHVFWYNRRWFEYTGATPEEMDGWGWKSVIAPETLPDALERWNQSIATGEPFNMVLPLLGADNRFRPFLSLVNPLRGYHNEIILWFGTNTDISEQKQAEEELSRAAAAEKQRSELLSRVAESSRSINAVLSAESIARILTEEACEIIGTRIGVTTFTSTDDCTQQIWAARTGDEHINPDGNVGLAVESTGFDPEVAVAVCRQKRSVRLARAESGAQRWGRLAVPLLGHGGKSLGVVQVADKQQGEFTPEDEAILMQLAAIAAGGIENARLYERVREQDQRKDEFLATLAHELRNPLAPIRTGLSVLKLISSPDDMTAAREMMERQVGHMVRLIDDLLDVSRITRGKVELKRERVDVRSVIDAALEVTRPVIDASNHMLFVAPVDRSLKIDADPTRIAQVISNLLNNAAKYTPEGGRIELATERDANEVVISVRDNGVGIGAEMLPKVFEMFTQVGRTIDRAQGGLGIGLALVTRLVEMHGGTVKAHSEGLGHGSRFSVHLPLVSSDEASTTTQQRGTSPFSMLSARRILVVDDNVDGAQTLAMLLKFAGHTTTTAFTGPAALEVAETFDPEVVFLDIGLPGMNGYEVAQRLRADPASQGLVLVALTGWGTDDDRRRARQAGFDHHLTKPVDAARVQSLLAEVSATQQKGSL
jgi:PAS domain S-box-containing protein